MNRAGKLYRKYLCELKALQRKCKHHRTGWAAEEWAPGHQTDDLVRACCSCAKILERKEGGRRDIFETIITNTQNGAFYTIYRQGGINP